MTKAATQLEEVLEPLFPGIRFGRVNCRRIAGSSRWSQHAWPGGNARDLYPPIGHPDPTGFIDDVIDWLRTHEDALSVRLILWGVADHLGHAHVDLWPTGWGTPPCAGGLEQYQYSDGRVVTEHDPEPENGDYMFTHFLIGQEYPEWEPIVWQLYLLEGGAIDANKNSGQVQDKLPWKTNVRLVEDEDFDLIAELTGLSNPNRIRMTDDGLYRYGKELASIREKAYA